MPSQKTFFPRQVVEAGGNRWDWALLPLVLAVIVVMAFGARQMATPYQIGTELPISLDMSYLPYYLLRTTLRMFMALIASLIFSVSFAVLASKYRAAEKFLVPMLDILQSIPILGFLSITVTGFIALFPGSLFGVECAAIFAIFTSQAWNMAFSLYQSFRNVPAELAEASRVFQLSGWQRFWRLDMPFAMPALLWNMMMSMSGGWFFVVASEAISVSNQNIKLPGIGSYIAVAIEAKDLSAIGLAVGAMLFGILLYDQLFFRPLLAWADKFRFEEIGGGQEQSSWLLTWLRRTERLQTLGDGAAGLLNRSFGWFRRHHDGTSIKARALEPSQNLVRAWDAALPPQRALKMIHAWLTQGAMGARFCERYFPQAGALVIGHFHHLGCWINHGRLVINTGSFVSPGRAHCVTWQNGWLRRSKIDESPDQCRVGRTLGAWRF